MLQLSWEIWQVFDPIRDLVSFWMDFVPVGHLPVGFCHGPPFEPKVHDFICLHSPPLLSLVNEAPRVDFTFHQHNLSRR